MKTSIKWKIISVFVLLQALVLIISGVYLNTKLNEFFYHRMDLNMEKQVKLLSNLIAPEMDTQDYDQIQEQVKKLSKEIDGRITVIDEDGIVLADSEEDPGVMENHNQRPEVVEARENGMGEVTRYSTTVEKDMKYIAKLVKPGGYVRLAIPVKEVQDLLNNIFTRLIIGLALAFAIFFILALWVSESITEPIKQITETAQKIAKGRLGERIHIFSRDEIGNLSRTFNTMAYQLEETIKRTTNEKERLATILETMVDGLIALDTERKVMIINSAATKMFGVTEEEAKGKTLIEINRNKELTESVQKVYETREPVSTEINVHYPEETILRTHLAPITHNKVHIRGVVIIFTDITELRRLEKMRTEFVGNVSHELKTPLTSIKGYVETLLEMELEESSIVKKFLGVINKESQRLACLIDDLLDLSRLENKQKQRLMPTMLGDVIGDVISVLRPKAVSKDLDLEITIPEFLPRVMGVKDQLTQVLMNLVDNAIKYTPDGGYVKVTARPDKEWVEIRVEDDGIGIPPGDMERIFERFYRVDKARSRQMGSTGLGLSIVKHIIKGHGGHISVESAPGEGSTFIVKLKRVQ